MRLARTVFSFQEKLYKHSMTAPKRSNVCRREKQNRTYRVSAEALDESAGSCERLRAVKANSPFHRVRLEFRTVKGRIKSIEPLRRSGLRRPA